MTTKTDEKQRVAAEEQYSITAHDYVKNPVGSRDWTLYWRGWQAAVEADRAQEPVATTLLRLALEHAQEWISATPHGDNCYLDPDHDLGKNCECGKESVLAYIESTLEDCAAPVAAQVQPTGYEEAGNFIWDGDEWRMAAAKYGEDPDVVTLYKRVNAQDEPQQSGISGELPSAQDREDAEQLVTYSCAKHWHDLYRAECRRRQDDAAGYGSQIQDLEAESILLGQILSDWHNRGETGDVDGGWLQEIVVKSGLATLNDEGYVLTQRAMELIGMADAVRKEQP